MYRQIGIGRIDNLGHPNGKDLAGDLLLHSSILKEFEFLPVLVLVLIIMIQDDLRCRKRCDYNYFLDYQLRWADNDMYAHVNNAQYYHLIDSIVNTYLIMHCGLVPSPPIGKALSPNNQIGLVPRSHCTYFSPVSFPGLVTLGLRIAKLGKNSVEYEVGFFEEEKEEVCVVGGFVHVFVDRLTRKVDKSGHGMGKELREGLERLRDEKIVDSKNISKL
ncbi:MAG: hypothetical protein M1834_008994 [Cirrosporium novae-zelandiae]|nr:MAG: hypothetical protein M1834_008994 [Cirrosporium novae-zelandiae]